MGVFRRARWVTKPNGRRVRKRAENYTIEYTDAAGVVRRVRGTTSKEESREIEARLKRESARERAGLETRTDRQTLRPIAEHVIEFEDTLEGRGRTRHHVDQTTSRINAILDAIGAQRFTDVTAHAVSEWAREARTRISPTTVDGYLRALKGFTRWAWREGRLTADPLAGLSLTGARGDLRYKRRALTEEEIRKALTTTRASTRTYRGMSGIDRHAIYLTAVSTGLRAGELAALRVDDLALDADPPTVTVRASTTKNRTEAVLPLTEDVASILQERVSRLLPAALVFPGTWSARCAAMLREDLAEAEIKDETADGRIDFHALRGSFVTRLARSGVGLADAQRLARHSTPVLTANVYTKLRLDDAARAVAKLPRLIDTDEARAEMSQ